jgi:hypothetical protein
MNDTTIAIGTAGRFGSLADGRILTRCPRIIFTRTQLLATGWHIDLSTLAEQAGFQVHVFFRIEAFTRVVEERKGMGDARNDLYTAMFALREAVMCAPLRGCPIRFQLDDVTFVARFGNVDHDDPRPAITVSLAPPNDPNEDED